MIEVNFTLNEISYNKKFVKILWKAYFEYSYSALNKIWWSKNTLNIIKKRFL